MRKTVGFEGPDRQTVLDDKDSGKTQSQSMSPAFYINGVKPSYGCFQK